MSGRYLIGNTLFVSLQKNQKKLRVSLDFVLSPVRFLTKFHNKGPSLYCCCCCCCCYCLKM